MADDQDKQGPSLEPPRLFGRSKKAAKAVEPAPVPAGDDDTATTVFADDDPAPTTTLETQVSAVPVREVQAEPVRPATEAPPTPAPPVVMPAKPAKPAREPRAAREPRPPKAPRVPRAERTPVDGRVAAVVSGLAAGVALVVLVELGLQGCQAVKGTDSCGAGPGLALLALVFVLGVVVGRFALAFFGAPDPASTSFLAVGITCVLSLLFLINVLDTWPMLIVIPVLTALTMLLSWFVTTRFIEPADT